MTDILIGAAVFAALGLFTAVSLRRDRITAEKLYLLHSAEDRRINEDARMRYEDEIAVIRREAVQRRLENPA